MDFVRVFAASAGLLVSKQAMTSSGIREQVVAKGRIWVMGAERNWDNCSAFCSSALLFSFQIGGQIPLSG